VLTRNAESAWLARSVRATAPRVRLFCFPYAGGGLRSFVTRRSVCRITSKSVPSIFRVGRRECATRRSPGWPISSLQ
jgi:hypothetical protein